MNRLFFAAPFIPLLITAQSASANTFTLRAEDIAKSVLCGDVSYPLLTPRINLGECNESQSDSLKLCGDPQATLLFSLGNAKANTPWELRKECYFNDVKIDLQDGASLKISGRILPGFYLPGARFGEEYSPGGFSFLDLEMSFDQAIGYGFKYSKAGGKGELASVGAFLALDNQPLSDFAIHYVKSTDVLLEGYSYANNDPLKPDTETRWSFQEDPELLKDSYLSEYSLGEKSGYFTALLEAKDQIGAETRDAQANQLSDKGVFINAAINQSGEEGELKQGINEIEIEYKTTDSIWAYCFQNPKECLKVKGGDTMEATFDISKAPGLEDFVVSIGDFAVALGYSHLNWLNLITDTNRQHRVQNGLGDVVYDGSTQAGKLSEPFIDGTLGGNIISQPPYKKGEAFCYQLDSYDPYFNIVPTKDDVNYDFVSQFMQEECDGVIEASGVASDYADKDAGLGTFAFFDRPSSLEGEFVQFRTILAGVKEDKTSELILFETNNGKRAISFDWKSTVWGFGAGGTNELLALNYEPLENFEILGGSNELLSLTPVLKDDELALLQESFDSVRVIDLSGIDLPDGDDDSGDDDTPNPPQPTSIPEPSVVLGILGVLALGLKKKVSTRSQ